MSTRTQRESTTTTAGASRETLAFLKWPGAKGRVVHHLLARAPERFGVYHEPFLGSGALFFALRPAEARLSDLNAELINCYTVVQREVDALVRELKRHPHTERHYYTVRAQDRHLLSPVQAAARTIFLNKTCFNGLYRVNKAGRFNAAFGDHRNPRICDEQKLRTAARLLTGAELDVRPFESVLECARRGDFVYLDPPYCGAAEHDTFGKYTPEGFRAVDHDKVLAVVRALDRRGCWVMVSMPDTRAVRAAYSAYEVQGITVRRLIACKASARRPVRELIVTNYRPCERGQGQRDSECSAPQHRGRRIESPMRRLQCGQASTRLQGS